MPTSKMTGEIVIFDDIHKYEIHIPIPAFTAPKGPRFDWKGKSEPSDEMRQEKKTRPSR